MRLREIHLDVQSGEGVRRKGKAEMKHHKECPGSYHCVCNIIADRDEYKAEMNRYKAAIKKALTIRSEMGSVPFPDYAASMTAALTKVMPMPEPKRCRRCGAAQKLSDAAHAIICVAPKNDSCAFGHE